MRRRQLFEFEDQPWLPPIWRNLLTDVLAQQLAASRMYAPAAPKLIDLLERTGATRIIDCCSGTGGPWPALLDLLGGWGGEVLLTDKFPRRLEAAGRRIAYHPAPVDALALPGHWAGVRTFFTSFHHFRPAAASAILRAAAAQGAGIGIFEFTARRRATVLGMQRSAPGVRAAASAITPQSRAHRLWISLIPVVPLLYWWDGTVSHLRTYTPAELLRLAPSALGYAWEAGTIPAPASGYPITYLIGSPAPARES